MLCTAIESDLAYFWLFCSQGQLNKHCACRKQEKLVLNKSNCPSLLKINIMELPSLSWGAKMVAGLLIYQIRIKNMELSCVLKGHKQSKALLVGLKRFFYTEANLKKKSMYKLFFLHKYFVLLHFR